jgi:hypothetical protein
MNRPRIDENGLVNLPSVEALTRPELREWIYERLHGKDESIPSGSLEGTMPHYIITVIYPKLERLVREDIQNIIVDFLRDLATNSESSWRDSSGVDLLMLTGPILSESARREDAISLLTQLADSSALIFNNTLRFRVLAALVTLQCRMPKEFWFNQAETLPRKYLSIILEGLALVDISAILEWFSVTKWDESINQAMFFVFPVIVESYTAAKFISVLDSMISGLSVDAQTALRRFCDEEGLSLSPSSSAANKERKLGVATDLRNKPFSPSPRLTDSAKADILRNTAVSMASLRNSRNVVKEPSFSSFTRQDQVKHLRNKTRGTVERPPMQSQLRAGSDHTACLQ